MFKTEHLKVEFLSLFGIRVLSFITLWKKNLIL